MTPSWMSPTLMTGVSIPPCVSFSACRASAIPTNRPSHIMESAMNLGFFISACDYMDILRESGDRDGFEDHRRPRGPRAPGLESGCPSIRLLVGRVAAPTLYERTYSSPGRL